MSTSAVQDVFRAIITAEEIERDLIDSMKDWFPTYLREVEHQLGMTVGELPEPAMYDTSTEFDFLDPGRLPLILAVSPGLASPPSKDGEGIYRAPWLMAVGAVVAGNSEKNAKKNAKIYGAAVRACVLQKRLKTLGGAIEWTDESYDDLPEMDQRSMAVANCVFWVEVDDVVSRVAGPLAPADPVQQPGSDWPTADTVTVEIEREEDPDE